MAFQDLCAHIAGSSNEGLEEEGRVIELLGRKSLSTPT